jgi:hypothetical protein
VEPPRQPAKYDFAPGVAPDGSLYPVHERKPPAEVAQRLVELGAWRLLRTTAGHTPLAVVRQRGHRHLFDVLQPVVRQPLDEDAPAGSKST